MMTRTRLRASTLRLGSALLTLLLWLLAAPFIALGYAAGAIAWVVRFIIAALIEGFERGYRRA